MQDQIRDKEKALTNERTAVDNIKSKIGALQKEYSIESENYDKANKQRRALETEKDKLRDDKAQLVAACDAGSG